MAVVLNWAQWWGLSVGVMKEGVRLGLSEIGSGARAWHFALFRGIVHAPISTLYLLQSEFGCVIF